MEIIINADDYGYSREINEAIQYCLKSEIVDRASLMVNMPYAEEAVNWAKENGYVDRIGLHINLADGKPLTETIKSTVFCDEKGYFNRKIMSGVHRLLLLPSEKKAVCEEIQAQIHRFLTYNLTLRFVDSHLHAHTNLPILNILLKELGENGQYVIRLARNYPPESMSGVRGKYKGIINKRLLRFNGKAAGEIEYFTTFCAYKGQEEEKGLSGKLIELMCHPVMKDGIIDDLVEEDSIVNWLDSNNLRKGIKD